MRFTLCSGDAGSAGGFYTARVVGAGAFDVVVDTRDLSPDADNGRIAWDDDETCSLEVGGTPPAYQAVPVSHSTEPFVYEAPAGTVEALGIGAPSVPFDGRFGLALHAASGTTWPFTSLWLPSDLEGLEVRPLADRGSCRSIDASWGPRDARGMPIPAGQSGLSQQVNCGLPPRSGTLIADTDGFARVLGQDRMAVRIDATGVVVTVSAPSPEALDAVLATLRPYPVVRASASASLHALDLAELLADLITRSDLTDAAERARLPYGDGELSVWVGRSECADCDGLLHFIAFEVQDRAGVSYAQTAAGSGIEPCYGLSGSSQGPAVMAVALDAAWRFQRRGADGWYDVDSTQGAWVPAGVSFGDIHVDDDLRVVDATGTVPCGFSGQSP